MDVLENSLSVACTEAFRIFDVKWRPSDSDGPNLPRKNRLRFTVQRSKAKDNLVVWSLNFPQRRNSSSDDREFPFDDESSDDSPGLGVDFTDFLNDLSSAPGSGDEAGGGEGAHAQELLEENDRPSSQKRSYEEAELGADKLESPVDLNAESPRPHKMHSGEGCNLSKRGLSGEM